MHDDPLGQVKEPEWSVNSWRPAIPPVAAARPGLMRRQMLTMGYSVMVLIMVFLSMSESAMVEVALRLKESPLEDEGGGKMLTYNECFKA